MAVGVYGNNKLSDADYNDLDIFYSYSPDRNTLGDTQMAPLFGSITNNEFRKINGVDGANRLRLPASVFNKLGFYLVMIKPKSFSTTIVDCSNIVTNTNQEIQISKKGIVIPKLQFQSTGSLVGYQVEYFDDNGVKVKNFHRIITSSDLVSLGSNNSTSSANATTYFLDANGTQLFLTVSPDEVGLISNTQASDLGKGGQKIIISNTFFDPVIFEVNLVENTLDTLSIGMFGNSTRDLTTGLMSIFDNNNSLYKQFNLITRKSQFSNGNIDIKEQRTNINLNTNFNSASQ